MFMLWISMCFRGLMKFHHCLFQIIRKDQKRRRRTDGRKDRWIKGVFLAWHFFMNMLNIPELFMQSTRKFQYKLWYKLISPCMLCLRTSITLFKSKQEKKWQSSQSCHVSIINFLHSSCKCSMFLYCVGKVSDCFIKSDWHVCALSIHKQNPWTITKGNNSYRIGP